MNQDKISDELLPLGKREHTSLRPGIELSKSSDDVIIGRLDTKIRGEFYKCFKSKSLLLPDKKI